MFVNWQIFGVSELDVFTFPCTVLSSRQHGAKMRSSMGQPANWLKF